MKFTFSFKNRTSGEAEKLVVEKAPSELEWHIVLKILGYILFFDRKPKIEQDVDWHYRPDLFTKDEMDRVNLWIDCGNIALKKVDRVATKMGKTGEFFILKRDKAELLRFKDELTGSVKHLERVRMIAFDPGFVDTLAEKLDSTNMVEFTKEADSLNLKISNRLGDLETKTQVWKF